MSEQKLNELLNQINELDIAAMTKAQDYQSKLAKPPQSLGKLEDISIRLAGITGNIKNEIENKRIIVLCADNGIIAEGVSSAPKSVTVAQAINMTKRKTGMSSMAKYFNVDVQVVDVGIDSPYDCNEILNAKTKSGTNNFLHEDAMTRDECVDAILLGINLAKSAKEQNFDIIGVGEMGIGNTSSSSAVLSVLTDLSIETITGRGGGLTDDAFTHKKKVLEEAISLRKPIKDDPIDVISKVGGLDIAAMCGVFLGCSIEKVPVVIDGFISAVAALCATRLCDKAKYYMFPSHKSVEPGYLKAIDELELAPYIDMDMRLGEGSGCVLAFEIISAACAMTNGTALFNEDSNINDEYLTEIRKGDSFKI